MTTASATPVATSTPSAVDRLLDAIASGRGGEVTSHHCHLLTLDDVTGLISRHRVFCGGRWDTARLAEMEAAQLAH